MVDFAADLKRLSVKCEFGAYLDEALRDPLVCGLGSEATLLTETGLTYARALEVALSNETANARARQPGSASVKFVQKSKEEGHQEACFCCGKANHTRAKFRGYTDRKLPFIKKGHIKIVKDDSEYEYESEDGIATIMQVGPGPLKLDVSLDDKPLCMDGCLCIISVEHNIV